MKKMTKKVLLVLMFVCLVSLAPAALLSHEDFSGYANDGVTQLDDDTPSPAVTGYVGNWVHASTSWGTGDIASQPGGYVSGNDGFAEGTSGRVARLLDASISATEATEGTLYLGWLFSVNGTSAVTYEMLALYDGIGNTNNDGFRNFDAGVTGNGGLGGGVYGFGADNDYASTGVSLDTGWHLLVARFDLSSTAAGDSITVWVDPTSEASAGVTISGKDLTWDTLTLSDYDEVSGSWDDIKWGTTFNDVLPTPDHATMPDPANGETGIEPNLSGRTVAYNLSWATPNDPNIYEIEGYDLFLDPNELKVANRDLSCLIIDSTTGVTQYDPASDFDYLATYYWTVDTRYTRDDDPNLGTVDETIYVGSPAKVWSFTTVSAAPIIQAYDSVVTTSALLPAALSAVVTDADSDLATAAFTLLADDLDFPAGAGASLQNANVANPYAPSVELVTDTAGTYKIMLTVDDGTNITEDVAEVVIYDDACEAAQAAPSWAGFNAMDFDTDCDVDLADLAEFVLQWLDDRDLAAQETYTANPEYLPVVKGVVNGNFELGDFTGFWHSDDAVITAVDPIEGAYSVEWTVDGGDGIANYMQVEANKSYEWSTQITGGVSGVDDEFRVRYRWNFTPEGILANAIWTPTTPPTVQTVTVPFTTGPDDEGVWVELIIYSPTAGTYYKVDDWRLVEVAP